MFAEKNKSIIIIYLIAFAVMTCEQPPMIPPETPPLLSVYGKLENLTYNDDFLTFHIHSEIVDWELDSTYLEIETSHLDVEVTIGNKYVYYFTQQNDKEGLWDNVNISENLEEYKRQGKIRHEYDLKRNQLITTKPCGQVSEIIPTPMKLGEYSRLQILLINTQDNDIMYRIKDAKIVNEEASMWYGYWWQLPPYEERLQNAVIEECNVSFDSSETVLKAGSTKKLTFNVFCPEDVSIIKTYEICDVYDERKNCRIITADRNNLMLWGEIEFTDELENQHIFPEKGVLKQFLEIEQ